jgi:hypothetical protein
VSGGTITLDATPLQQALFPFVCSMEIAAELDERSLDAFLQIVCIRVARDVSQRWWQA